MAETIYHVIDREEKRIKWDHYDSLDAFVASLSQNPETINEFNQVYRKITGESFYQEGPKTADELANYLIVESDIEKKPAGQLVTSLETRDKKLWFIYQKSDEDTYASNLPLVSIGFLRELYELQNASDEDVIQSFQVTVNDYGSFNPNEKVSEDIPEITPELVREWENSPHKKEYPTVNDYRRSPEIDGCSVDGIVVADLRKKELRYLSNPNCFDIPRNRPTDHDGQFGQGRVEYTLPTEWKLIQE